MSGNFFKQKRREHRQEASEHAETRSKARNIKILGDIKESYRALEGLMSHKNPGAWKSFMYLRKRYRLVRRKAQDAINDPRTPHDDRLVLIGERRGIEMVFTFVSNIQDWQKKAESNRGEEVVSLFPSRGG